MRKILSILMALILAMTMLSSVCLGAGPLADDELSADGWKMSASSVNVNQETPEKAIDGNIARGFDIPAKPVIHGDAISPSIAAASILAKVTRDRKCIEWDAMYPQYKIAKHKGYGTKDHMAALREFGPSPIHRKKFIRFLDEE